jgi:uncharacterized protein (TIGR03435 family)
MRSGTAAMCAFAMLPVMAAAQQFLPAAPGPPVDPSTRFEVVSVKPWDNTSGQMMMRMTPGRFESMGVPLSVLVRQALQKPDYQIVGTPGWTNTERFAIQATLPEGTPPSAITVMLVNLLKDRFQLATRVETREQPIFNLVTARTDGRLGPDLKPTPAACQATIEERIAAAKQAAGRGGPPALPPFDPNAPLPCGFVRVNPGVILGSGRTMAQILPMLSDLLGRPVIDKTGLAGLYDFSLKFVPEARSVGPFGPVPGAPAPVADPDAPSLSAAVQEQLGLKLEGARGPVEVAVIEKLEKPTLD